jgi:hypothetical protein
MDQLVFAEFKSFFNKGECPICQLSADHLKRFYFWFVTEQYYQKAKGPEQTSWIRAAEFFIGKRDDSLALMREIQKRPVSEY